LVFDLCSFKEHITMREAEPVSIRAIRAVAPMPYHGFDEHSGAHMLRADASWLDPFIGIDSFTMPQPFFGPHPHAGMSAVTVMLPESEAGFINRDSLGDRSTIEPGDLHWTQAGRGMMHEEVPAVPGLAAHGLQVFVNLSRANKQAQPVAFHVNHADMPRVQGGGGSVRVIAGEFAGRTSPIAQDARWLTRVNMLDVTLEPGAELNIPVTPGDNAFFVVRSGSFSVPAGDIPAQAAIIFEADGAAAHLKAGRGKLRGVFFSGTPLGEPVYPKGPFMGNTAHDVAEYAARFQRGEMGSLSKSF
jgi:redox-sensitive bicupin YhaK (pirin superfamily)